MDAAPDVRVAAAVMLLPDECVAEVDGLGLDEEARDLLLAGNAMRVVDV